MTVQDFTKLLALYEQEPIGLDGALEATNVFYFCCDACRQQFINNRNPSDKPLESGVSSDFESGTVCDQCDRPAETDQHFANQVRICCGEAIRSEQARRNAEVVETSLEGVVIECPHCQRGMIYHLATGWRRYWKPCDLCENDTSFERHNQAEPPEGHFCQDCGNWICPDCEGGYRTDGEGARMVCQRCKVNQ